MSLDNTDRVSPIIRWNLIQKTAFFTSIAFIFFILLTGLYSQEVLKRQIIGNMKESISVLTRSEGSEMDEHFKQFEKIGATSRNVLTQWLSESPDQKLKNEFDKKYYFEDGALRTNFDAFNSGDVSGIFLSNKGELNEDIKDIIIQTEGKFENYAKGVKASVFNSYLITKHQLIRIYEKDWVQEIEADHDFRQDSFYNIADPIHDPEREVRWTAPYYDSIWKHWMTSLITPIYINDEFIGIVGHDIILDDLYTKIFNKEYFENGYAFIFDSNNNIIVHPFYYDRLLKSGDMGTTLSFKDVADEELSNVISELVIKDTNAAAVATESFSCNNDQSYIFSYKMDMLNWHYAVVIPKDEILALMPEFRKKFLVSAFTLAFLLFSVVLLILWVYVIKPIKKLTKVSKEITDGNSNIRAEVHSNDEIGQLARSFNSMNQKIYETVDSLNTDIRKREIIEAALIESEKKYKGIIENSIVGLLIYQDDQVKLCNPKCAQILGYDDYNEIIGVGIFDIINMESAKNVLGLRQKLKDHSDVDLRTSVKAHKKDGSFVDVEALGSEIEYQGKPAIQVVVRDVSERRRLEEQLFQSQKMESIGRLAGGVAHDFNNLLTAIIGTSELAMMSINEENPIYSNIEEIINTADRAAELTSQLLAFSRKQIIAPKVIDLNDTIPQMDLLLRRTIGENIDLVTVQSENLGCIKADPSQLEQVIMNLSVNARDAMLEGGKLKIETRNVEFDSEYIKSHREVLFGKYVLLAISDNGTGIDEKTQRHIFEPFFTTKGVGKGTGLGLSTVYGIVKQNNGFLSVDSEIGEGTIFKIYFPRVDEHPDKVTIDETSFVELSGTETVFIVEDNNIVRDSAIRSLQRFGYKVESASSGEEALNYLLNPDFSPDIVLSDVVMPNMSGADLAKQLKKDGFKKPILFMSGYTEDAIVHHGVLDPDIPFIQKPFKPNDLAKMVRNVLDTVDEIA